MQHLGRSFTWLLLTLLCCASIACAKKKVPDPKLWEIQTPQARVVSMKVTSQTDDGFRVEATVQLDNENRVPLPLLDIHYTIAIEGVGSISLVDHAHRTIPAFGSQRIVLPASFAWEESSIAGLPWQVEGNVKYQPPGELRQIMTETNIPLPDSTFKNSGKLE